MVPKSFVFCLFGPWKWLRLRDWDTLIRPTTHLHFLCIVDVASLKWAMLRPLGELTAPSPGGDWRAWIDPHLLIFKYWILFALCAKWFCFHPVSSWLYTSSTEATAASCPSEGQLSYGHTSRPGPGASSLYVGLAGDESLTCSAVAAPSPVHPGEMMEDRICLPHSCR